MYQQITKKWLTIGQLILCLNVLSITSQNTSGNNNLQQNSVPKNSKNVPSTAGDNVDDILKDTFLLLDILDEKLTSVNNKTPNALMKDKLRSLDLSESTKTDEISVNSDAKDRIVTSASNIDQKLSVVPPPEQFSANDFTKKSTRKNARQLTQSDIDSMNQLAASDSTERHIGFTLDLMQAIFASQMYSAKTQQLESFLISPLSIQTVLMMMHLGAKGQTRKEISNCLHLTTNSTPVEDGNISPLQQSPSNSKLLKRRHQQAISSAAFSSENSKHQTVSSNHKPQLQQQQTRSNHQHQNAQKQQQQISTSSANSMNAAHELFGNSIKNLFKDMLVTKALTNANQIFLQKNLPLAAQYDWAIRHYYGADVKLVDFQHQIPAPPTSSGSQQTDNKLSATAAPSTSLSPSANASSKSSSNSDQQHLASQIAPQLFQNASGSNNATSLPPPPSLDQNTAQQLINDWVERQTRGKISNFLPAPVSSSTLMMALNVLYFKGDWQFKFDPSDTEQDAWFTQANGKMVKLQMMVNRLPLAFAHDPIMKTSVIELPYKAQRLGLFLLLPDEVSGIFHTMQMLNSTSFANLISSMRKPTQPTNAADQSSLAANSINVRIPKFSIESSPRLSQILAQQLGLKSLFSPDVADLSGMFANNNQQRKYSNITYEQSPLQVGLDELLHKAILQIDEQGSVAAASSATIVERVGLFNNNYFEADHPFLLFLMDKQTGLVLFSGAFAGNGQPTTNQQAKDSMATPTTTSTTSNGTSLLNNMDVKQN